MIRLIAEGFNSKTDRNGNRYWAFRLTNTQTGAVLKGKLGAAMDGTFSYAISQALRALGWEWDDVRFTETAMGSREFGKLVKSWPYSHHTEAEVLAFARGGAGTGGKRRHAGKGVHVASHARHATPKARKRSKVTSHARRWPDVLPDAKPAAKGKRKARKVAKPSKRTRKATKARKPSKLGALVANINRLTK